MSDYHYAVHVYFKITIIKLISDLLPGRMYTIFVSTVNAITSQIPEDQFADISVSVQTVTTTSDPVSDSDFSTAAIPSSSTLDASHLTTIIVVPVTVVMVSIGVIVVILLLILWYVYVCKSVILLTNLMQIYNYVTGHIISM